ncbi:MAG: hypothetical protein COT84_00630 [Chlamydiae bacterium CG10_big_fil_rev_8_21_14_0_10_35_9]|nr:MAG: hypothetical protein COT84_00630 [Chlamydiae bacterium CG10_big_fil_rev_8_21_14_0_10_35_9]
MSMSINPLPYEIYFSSNESFNIDSLKIALRQHQYNEALQFFKKLDEGQVQQLSQEEKNIFLHIALADGNFELTQRLIDQGADIQAIDERDGQTALMTAITASNTLAIWLLDTFPFDLNATDTNGDSALHLAIENNSLDVAAKLLEKGANVNQKDAGNHTPLEWLLDNYAQYFHEAMQGYESLEDIPTIQEELDNLSEQIAPATLYLYLNDRSVFDGFSQEQKNLLLFWSVLYWSEVPTQENLLDIITEMLSKGADINAQNFYGNTLLMLTITEYLGLQSEIEDARATISELEQALAREINIPLVKQQELRRILHVKQEMLNRSMYLQESIRSVIVLFIHQENIDLTLKDFNENSALNCAMDTEDCELILLLIEKNSDFNPTNLCSFLLRKLTENEPQESFRDILMALLKNLQNEKKELFIHAMNQQISLFYQVNPNPSNDKKDKIHSIERMLS